MKRLTATLFLANFTAALAVSVFQKIVHIVNALAGRFGLRDGPYKFIWTMETDTRELFDVEKDPGETESIGSDHPMLIDGYVRVIERWMAHSAHLIENYADIIGRTPR